MKIPLRGERIRVPAGKVDQGKMTHQEKAMTCIPSKTHCKGLLPVLNKLHKIQVGKELPPTHATRGRQASDHVSVNIRQLHSKTAEAQARGFVPRRCERDCRVVQASRCHDGHFASHHQSECDLLAINDRASTARKAARMVLAKLRGVEVETIQDGPTCAEHAWVNYILEEGRKAIDKVLREMMNITDELAESDAKKVKAMRTAVGWFSSPACAVIYQVSKYVAAFSSKGYAIGVRRKVCTMACG